MYSGFSVLISTVAVFLPVMVVLNVKILSKSLAYLGTNLYTISGPVSLRMTDSTPPSGLSVGVDSPTLNMMASSLASSAARRHIISLIS